MVRERVATAALRSTRLGSNSDLGLDAVGAAWQRGSMNAVRARNSWSESVGRDNGQQLLCLS